VNSSELIYSVSRPYSTLLVETNILGKLFASKHLAFNMQAQTQSNWCWAATSTSVSHYYWLWSTWTQCRVANGELGHNDCCASPVPSACNVPWYLDRALTRTHNFVSAGGPATFQQVRAEIEAGRPVGARIGWSGGGGHFMVIYGYSLVVGSEYFDIDDPIYGKSHLSVADFSSNYQGSGTWTDTYFTKSYFRMPIKPLIPIEPVLKRIWELRPLLALKRDTGFADAAFDPAKEQHASVGLAHRVYSIPLDALARDTVAAQPVNVRVYEMQAGVPRAFFDVTEGDDARVLQMSEAKSHLEPFAHALSQAVAAASGTEAEAELALLRVPALNFEGLWLKYDGKGQDTVIPLRAVGQLQPDQPVPYDDAVKALREAARTVANMDDKMGA
jgi:hypothetical protein